MFSRRNLHRLERLDEHVDPSEVRTACLAARHDFERLFGRADDPDDRTSVSDADCPGT